MLRTISLYILRETLGVFLVALVALTFMLPLAKIMSCVREGLPILVVLQIYGYEVPYALAWTLPLALLVACVTAYGRLAADNEVLAMRASGMHPARIALPVVCLSALVVLLAGYLNANVIPNCRMYKKNLQFKLALDVMDRLSGTIADRVNLGPVSMSFEYIDETYMYDVVVHLDIEEGAKIIKADKAEVQFDEDDEVIKLTLLDATVENVSVEGKFTSPQHFDRWPHPIYLDKPSLTRHIGWKDRSQANLKECLRRGKIVPLGEENSTDDDEWSDLPKPLLLEIETQVNRRRAMTWAPMAFVLIGVPLGLIARRGKRIVTFSMSLAVVLVFYPLMLAGEGLAATGVVPAWIALPSCDILVGGAGVVLMYLRVWRH